MTVWTLLAGAAAATVSAPAIDKNKLESYLRYAEGFMANVHFKIDEPVATTFPNFYRVNVHLSSDSGAKLDQVYYMTADGRQIVKGAVWDLTKSPFAETLAQMPQRWLLVWTCQCQGATSDLQ